MAVDFSLLPPQLPVPDNAPSPFVWSIVFVVLTLGGVAFVLWSWPPHEKTQTAWFWMCSAILPPCIAGALVSSFARCSVIADRRKQAARFSAAREYGEDDAIKSFSLNIT